MEEETTLMSAYVADNVDNFYNKLESVVWGVLHVHPKKPEPSDREDPLLMFLARHSEHPQMGRLLVNIENKDWEEGDRIIGVIIAGVWHDYLSTATRSNARSFYAYLAKAGVRRKWGSAPADTPPMVDQDVVSIGSRRKCEHIAEAFCYRLSARSVLEPENTYWNPNDRPLPPVRERLPDLLEPITLQEVRKAISRQASHRAPGPDKFPGGMYKKLDPLTTPLVRLRNLMMRTGGFLRVVRRLYLAPIFKPGKDAKLAASRWPISPLSAIVKIAEAVIYHRMRPTIEPQLRRAQCAYCMGRGTSQHLTEFGDFAQRAPARGHCCYLVSFDVAGACDNAPRAQLMRGLESIGAGGYLRRIVRNWLTARTFQLRTRTLSGNFYSSIYSVSKGLLQGGGLSPFLWNVFFDVTARGLAERQEISTEIHTRSLELVYADDVTALVSAETLGEVRTEAHGTVDALRSLLENQGLELNDKNAQHTVLPILRAHRNLQEDTQAALPEQTAETGDPIQARSYQGQGDTGI